MTETAVIDAQSTLDSPRRVKTQERLMDAAFEVFSEVGIHAASVEMIAERAGFTRGAFYSNFETKEELFLALAERGNAAQLLLLRQGVEQIAQLLPIASAGKKFAPADLGPVVAGFLEQQGDNRLWFLFQSELRLLAMREPGVGRRFLEQKREADAEFAAIIAAAFTAVGLTLKLDASEIANVLISVYERSLQEAIMAGGEDVQARAHNLVLQHLPPVLAELAE
jgi:AcrR family transcriptional regulator